MVLTKKIDKRETFSELHTFIHENCLPSMIISRVSTYFAREKGVERPPLFPCILFSREVCTLIKFPMRLIIRLSKKQH